MINYIVGPKGTGKTKILMQKIEEAVNNCSGAVLCIKKGDVSDVRVPLANNSIRLIDTNNFSITGFDELYGLISGAVASNYDIKEIFLDSTFRIGERNFDKLKRFLFKLNENVLKDTVNLTVTLSCEKEYFHEDDFVFAKT